MNAAFQCRSCGSAQGLLVLDLGVQPLANNLLRPEDLQKPEPKFPLRLAVCSSCWLMQILDTVPPADLFSEYLYFSSFSTTLLEHARNAAARWIAEFRLNAGSLVTEIASNDGYLLQHFAAAGIPSLGIEPAANIARAAREKGIETLTEFFDPALADRLAAAGRQADLILGNNVFAHVPDPNAFVRGLQRLLKPDGTVILEFPYGADLIEGNEFDTIYHEHVFYFTLTPLAALFRRHRLEVWQVEHLPIHGGSLRLFVCHDGARAVRPSVTDLLAGESKKGIATPGYYQDFARQVRQIRDDLRALIARLRAEESTIAAYGASAKGSTLLNYCGLGRDDLAFVADRSTYKQGRLTPGTHLPIAAPDELLRRMPAYTLLLTWNFAAEILAQQSAYRARGGRFILPIPHVQIV